MPHPSFSFSSLLLSPPYLWLGNKPPKIRTVGFPSPSDAWRNTCSSPQAGGKVWFGYVYPAKGEPDPSTEGQAAKKEVKEAAEERGGVPGWDIKAAGSVLCSRFSWGLLALSPGYLQASSSLLIDSQISLKTWPLVSLHAPVLPVAGLSVPKVLKGVSDDKALRSQGAGAHDGTQIHGPIRKPRQVAVLHLPHFPENKTYLENKS